MFSIHDTVQTIPLPKLRPKLPSVCTIFTCTCTCTCTCITHDEQVGIQIEEPFSILPLEAFCNSAIAATSEEMLGAVHSGVFEHDDE